MCAYLCVRVICVCVLACAYVYVCACLWGPHLARAGMRCARALPAEGHGVMGLGDDGLGVGV